MTCRPVMFSHHHNEQLHYNAFPPKLLLQKKKSQPASVCKQTSQISWLTTLNKDGVDHIWQPILPGILSWFVYKQKPAWNLLFTAVKLLIPSWFVYKQQTGIPWTNWPKITSLISSLLTANRVSSGQTHVGPKPKVNPYLLLIGGRDIQS